MLIFVDESEWPRPKSPGGYTVWAGVALHPKRGKEFFREIFNLERKFWKVEEPYDFEIKGRLLLNKKALTSPKKREFTEEILSLCKLNEILTFAVGLRYPDTGPLDTMSEPSIYRVFNLLLERVEAMMAESFPDEMAVVAFDSQGEGSDRNRALQFGNFLYGNPYGRAMQHIIDTPFFVNSQATKGIQIADLCAYAVSQVNLGRQELRPYFDRIREMEWHSQKADSEYPMRGFRFLDVT